MLQDVLDVVGKAPHLPRLDEMDGGSGDGLLLVVQQLRQRVLDVAGARAIDDIALADALVGGHVLDQQHDAAANIALEHVVEILDGARDRASFADFERRSHRGDVCWWIHQAKQQERSHAGEPRAYALIADQTPRKKDPKHWTRFLRQDTAFFVGADKIAKFLESPVYFVSMKRERRGYYEVRLDVLAEPPYEDIDDAVIVERYARCLERAIVDSPADWLWLQKKWKYAKPVPGEDKTYTEGVPARVRT